MMHAYGQRLGWNWECWRAFWWARFVRIAPLYYVTLAVMLGVFGGGWLVRGKWPSSITWEGLLANVAMVQNWPCVFLRAINQPSWSLSVEVLCYVLVMPLGLSLCRRLERTPLAAGLCIVCLVAARLQIDTSIIGWSSIARGVLSFLGGMILFGLRLESLFKASAKWLTLASVLGFVLLQGGVTWGGLGVAWPLLFCPSLILGLSLDGTDIVRRCLSSSPLLWLGDISFSLYLWQLPLIFVPYYIGRPRLIGLPLWVRALWGIGELSLVIGVAGLSYLHLELPCRQWLRRLAR